MWQINSCDLISGSVCIVDTIYSKDRWEVIKISMTFFVWDRVVKDASSYLRNK